ncbi:MAG: Type 1 glutamine amidotransferase-like domain-containing protein [Clostridia bacterium]|nr:Type 1 glutamine amidotransferase-like domain-containing protein [Clostridia bacterium]
MPTLFITSSPCAPAPDAKLPFVFWEGNGFAELFIRSLPPHPRVFMVAAYPDAHEHNDRMTADFQAALTHHGRTPEWMIMVDDRNAGQMVPRLPSVDLLILSGGHVPTQNRFFHECGLVSAAASLREDAVVMGISAGSMNMADTVYIQPEEKGEAVDPSFRRWGRGLGLTPFQILPHLQNVRNDILDGLRLFEDITFHDSIGHTFYALPDRSFLYAHAGITTLCGEGWTISDGIMTKVTSGGEHLTLRA